MKEVKPRREVLVAVDNVSLFIYIIKWLMLVFAWASHGAMGIQQQRAMRVDSESNQGVHGLTKVSN